MDSDQRAWPQGGLAGEWTWQEGRGYVLAEDEITDTRDVAAGLVHGDERAALAAAEFWALAAEVNAANAGIHAAQAQLAEAEESTPHTQAELEDATERHIEALRVSEEIQDIREEVQAEAGYGDVGTGFGESNPLEVAAIYDYLYSDAHAAGLTAEELAEYRDGVKLDAEQLAEAGYDVERLASDDAAIEAAAAASEGLTPEGAIATEDELLASAAIQRANAAAADGDEARPASAAMEEAWREGCALAYQDYIKELGNDGHPANDRHITAEQQAAWDASVAAVAAATGVDPEVIQAQMTDAAWAYGNDQGLDTDPDRFAPPEWVGAAERAGAEFDAAVNDQLAVNGREPAVEGAGPEALAKLLYDLDQTRCALEDDDTPEEDRWPLAQHAEHLEEQATELAEALSHTPFDPAPDAPEEPEDPDPAGWKSAAEAIANVPDWVAEQGPAAVAEYVAEQLDRESTEGDGDEGKDEEPSAAERAVAAAHEAVEAHLDEQERAPAMASAPAANTREDVDE